MVWGYDETASKVEGTSQFDAAQRLRLFPLGSRVRVIGYEKRLADARRLNGRTGRVDRGHFGGSTCGWTKGRAKRARRSN